MLYQRKRDSGGESEGETPKKQEKKKSKKDKKKSKDKDKEDVSWGCLRQNSSRQVVLKGNTQNPGYPPPLLPQIWDAPLKGTIPPLPVQGNKNKK